MQDEDIASYHPGPHGRRRFGRNRNAVVAAAVLFVGLVFGVFAGRWSVSSVHEFVEADSPEPEIPPKDPHFTVLDVFEGM